MAKKTNGNSAKRPVSTARMPSSAQSRTGAGKTSGSRAASSQKAAPKKNAAAKTAQAVKIPAVQAIPPKKAPRTFPRELGGIFLLFLGLVAFIAYFPVDAWLVTKFRILLLGAFGWGFYIAAPSLFLAGGILVNHKGRPVTLRVTFSLCLPWIFGSFIHILFCLRQDFFSGTFLYAVQELWKDGQTPETYCGGVLSGLLAVGLKYAISIYGGVTVLAIEFVLMLGKALNISLSDMAKNVKSRPQPSDGASDDDREDSDFFDPGELLYPLDGGKPIREKPIRESEGFNAPVDDDNGLPVPDLPRHKRTKYWSAPYDAQKDRTFIAPEKSKTAEPTKNVKPLSLEEAAVIAGVEVNSTAMDGPAAKKPDRIGPIDKNADAAQIAGAIETGEAEPKQAYAYPPVELLTRGAPDTVDARDEITKVRERLESAIRSFGVDAHITGVTHGPTVTRYDLELEQGVKLNKITNLAGDIALALGVVSVRIAPIPGQISTVGVEVPNRHVNTVWLRDILESKNFEKATSKLSFGIGKDIGGNAIVGNISKLPHLLIAGTTGSGKSVCINSLIVSLLYKSTPEEVRMIMIDPKMVELGVYNGMPHLYVPVVTDPKKAAGALQWSVVEMLKRYRLFSEAGVRDLTGYNGRQRKLGEKTLPQVVIIIDELADLMLVASKEVEESICRVAQMGRASGMHLVIATQRPSADVITGLMKANIPSRIAFAVSSAMESRIILDQSGAEKLIGTGDMLYCPLGIGKPMRVQGAFITDEEREKVIDFVKQVGEAEYSDEILEEIEKAAVDKNAKTDEAAAEDKPQSEFDELLPDAVDVIFETKQASVSMLQRRLKLGYSRAARLVDQMEQLGVVGPYEGSKPRQILITKQMWQEMQYSAGTAPADTIAKEFAKIPEDDTFAEAAPQTEPEGEQP
jgi:S-DNA-T family DNA segregation ATPase FtsK/SpoIIIE